MGDKVRKMWPYEPRNSMIFTLIILAGLLFLFLFLKKTGNWPTISDAETTILTGILLISLIPILLALADIIVERGGSLEIAGLKFDLESASQVGVSDLTVPANIGVPGQPVTDSDTGNILDTLRRATGCDVVVIDLEDGNAWWETRLLVLLAGAVRLKRPAKVAFVGRKNGVDRQFLGWASPGKLLSRLMESHEKYKFSYHTAMAAARQWELVEPERAGGVPPQPSWITQGLASQHMWMAFDNNNGLPNELLAEQYLANELGNEVELKEPARTINITRLDDLFHSVLHKEHIDVTLPKEHQTSTFFDISTDYFAMTQKGTYLSLASRLSVLNSLVKNIVMKS